MDERDFGRRGQSDDAVFPFDATENCTFYYVIYAAFTGHLVAELSELA